MLPEPAVILVSNQQTMDGEEMETAINAEFEELLLSLIPHCHRPSVRGIVHRMPESERFYNFVTQYREKIESELSKQRDLEDCQDVLCEVEFACLIAKFTSGMTYQVATPTGKNIDFLIDFKRFGGVGVEVKRIREVPEPTIRNDEGLDEVNYTQRESFKFTDNIMKALIQLLPDRPNVIYLKIESTTHELFEAGFALSAIIDRVNRNDLAFLRKHKFESRDHFMEYYRRMNVVAVRSKWGPSISEAGTNYNSNRVFVSGDASMELPENIVDIFRRGENWG